MLGFQLSNKHHIRLKYLLSLAPSFTTQCLAFHYSIVRSKLSGCKFRYSFLQAYLIFKQNIFPQAIVHLHFQTLYLIQPTPVSRAFQIVRIDMERGIIMFWSYKTLWWSKKKIVKMNSVFASLVAGYRFTQYLNFIYQLDQQSLQSDTIHSNSINKKIITQHKILFWELFLHVSQEHHMHNCSTIITRLELSFKL